METILRMNPDEKITIGDWHFAVYERWSPHGTPRKFDLQLSRGFIGGRVYVATVTPNTDGTFSIPLELIQRTMQGCVNEKQNGALPPNSWVVVRYRDASRLEQTPALN